MKTISVTQVLGALGRKAPPAEGAPSTRLLGQVFHEVFRRLTVDGPTNACTLLEDLDEDPDLWSAKLREHAYDRVFGPLLTHHATALSGSGERVLDTWKAVQGLCAWLARAYAQIGLDQDHLPNERWAQRKAAFRSEVEVEQELTYPSWKEPVLLKGRIDAILQPSPEAGRCLIELKSGRQAEEIGLAQLCLYELVHPTQGPGHHRIALLRFGAENGTQGIDETVLDPAKLGEAKTRLMALIGQITGVVGPPPPPPPPSDGFPEKLRRAYRDFGLDVRADGVPQVGPTFRRYPLSLGRGVNYARVLRSVVDIEVRMGLSSPLVIHRHGGQVVVDVLRSDRKVVAYDKVERPPERSRSSLLVGVEIDGTARYADLAEPTTTHILVAGTTGSGKSEWLRTAIASLVENNTPDTLRLLLIDPKRNAFTALKGSPFLSESYGMMFPPQDIVEDGLDYLIDEMEDRYKKLEQAGADTIVDLARKGGEVLPRVVLVCDEYFDLISVDNKQRQSLERRIAKLGAKARAAGIHLILATQQPSRRVVTGVIDANLSARVALKTSSAIESRSVLKAPGAEKLLGHGDLLFKDIGEAVRLQAPLMSDEDRQRVFGGVPTPSSREG